MTCGRTHSGFKEWLGENGYALALLVLFLVLIGGLYLLDTRKKLIEDLQGQLSTQSGHYEAKLEQKKQRLAAVLSHLEANPQIKTPGNHQSLIGPRAKMEWKYSTTEHGEDQSSRKDSALATQNAKLLGKSNSAVTGEATMTWQDDHRDKDTAWYSPKRSIIEIRDAADPLNRDKAKMAQVTGEAAWYPITLSGTLGNGGTFLWRVVEGERDTSGTLRAEGSWGPYSVFTIYRSAYERIKATRTIRIGSYNVAQLPVGKEISESKKLCEDPGARLSAGLSENDTDVLCKVIESNSTIKKFGKLTPVVKRYSDIDNKLLRDLKAGELDLAFGNISKAAYRTEKGVLFLTYNKPEPVLLTNKKDKEKALKIQSTEKIGIVQGTVYEHVLRDLKKNNQRNYDFEVCQNTFDAIDKLLKNDIHWVLMMGTQTWEEIQKSEDFKNFPLYRNETPEMMNSLPGQHEIGGDAFAMTEAEVNLHDAICLALPKRIRDCKLLGSPNSQNEEVSSRFGS